MTIPSSVINIEAGAFDSCSRLESVSIPSSVTNIGSGAFSGCLSLSAIDVDAGNTTYSSEDGVLFDITFSTLIRCPPNRIAAFVVPPSCNVIGDSAFADCVALSGVTIPSGVIRIGARAFENCVSLSSISMPSGITEIGEYAFRNCNKLAQVEIPQGITDIKRYTFSECASLSNLVIPETVTRIRTGAFRGCINLQEVSVPSGVTTIESSVFEGCTALASVMLPDGLSAVESSAFSGCRSLTSISIPEPVTTIGSFAFLSCRKLTSVFIPSGVTSIGSGAFGYCVELMEILVDSTNPSYRDIDGVLLNKTGSSLIQYPSGKTGEFEIPTSVAMIENSAFASCHYLTRVTMRSNLTSIGSSAFSNCVGLSQITIGEGVTDIGSYAFSGCVNLEAIGVEPLNLSFSSLDGVLYDLTQTRLIEYPEGRTGSFTLPASVTTIQSNTFLYRAALAAFHVDAANTTFSSVDGILYNKNKSNLIRCPLGKSGLVQIGANVTQVNRGAFSGCQLLTAFQVDAENPLFASLNGLLYNKNLTELIKTPNAISGIVTLSSMVSLVYDGALANCKNVTAIIVDSANPNFSSVDGMLFNKNQSQLIQCPGGKFDYALIPASVLNVGAGAFDDRDNLVGIVFLGNSPTSIYFSFDTSVPIQHFNGAIGFGDGSIWDSWPVENMGSESPIKLWLLADNYPYDSDVAADKNGDGVSLLMAYALNLNPLSHLASSMPVAQLEGGTLSITFYASSDGITYQVETSDKLGSWTTNNISISQPDSSGFRTASVPATVPARFIRLVVSE